MTQGLAGAAQAGATRPQPAWLDRYRAWRDRLLASTAFQRRAAAFAPTRWIARRRSAALFDLCAGFVYSQVLLACVRLRVIDALLEGPLTPAEIAARCGLTAAAAQRLLDAAAALGLAESRGHGRYGAGPLGAALAGNPGVAAMVEHHALLYADLGDPVALLRGEARERSLAGYWPYAGALGAARLGAGEVGPYSELMAASLPLVASLVLDAYPVARHQRVMDVGGGEGGFLVACAERAPDLNLVLYDLPAVAARAGERFARAGLQGRAVALGGDFRTDPLPKGADLVTLVRVIHDHDDEDALALLRRVREALTDEGSLVLAEPLVGPQETARVGAAYFGFYLLAMGSGRARSHAELRAMLHAAGFRHVRALPAHMPVCASVIHACGRA